MPGEPPVKIAAPRQGLSAMVPVYKKGGVEARGGPKYRMSVNQPDKSARGRVFRH
jgi:hypothetical protein